MHFKKKEITAFLDQSYPFNDEYAKKLYENPVIRKMAVDIEQLYENNQKLTETIVRLNRTIGRHYAFGAVVVTAGAIGVLIAMEVRATKREQQAKDKTIRGSVA